MAHRDDSWLLNMKERADTGIAWWQWLLLLAAAMGAALQLGCDGSEFERIRQRTEINERIREHCIPAEGEKIIVAWYRGFLICTRYAVSDQYRRVEVTPQAVATTEDILQ